MLAVWRQVLAYLDAVHEPSARPSEYTGRAAGVEASLYVMFAPVLDGGLSTLLGKTHGRCWHQEYTSGLSQQ